MKRTVFSIVNRTLATSLLLAGAWLAGGGVAAADDPPETAPPEAIDALEQIFRDHYRQLTQGCDDTA